MLKKIKITELKPGMFVVLPASSWFKHPFLKNSITIKSESDIGYLKDAGLVDVTIDTSRGSYVEDIETISHNDKDLSPPEKWEPEKLIPDELKEAISDKHLPPRKKAEAVYRASVKLMGKLFSSPEAENIKAAKEGIAEVVDLIISDNDTALNLLQITSYDFYTYTHSVNVGVLSVMLAKEIFGRSDAHDLHELGAGFFLHDLGKVRIDPAIINKPGRLTKEEAMIVKSHPYHGYKLLEDSGHLSEEMRVVVMQHHERSDGTGYPRMLKEEEIHIYAKICCIADVYDALTAERSYKPNIKPFEALKIMKEEMIGHFSDGIFEKFVLMLA
jgi:HD-GYP domain-containing protein (c-di-GMP phosphodiesterase class II)